MELRELFENSKEVNIDDIYHIAYSNSAKVEILNKLAVKLSDLTDLTTEIYIGTVSNGYKSFGLYLPINMKDNRVYFKSQWDLDLERNISDKKITISKEGLENLKFLILKIDKHNLQQNEIFFKLSQMVQL